MFAISRAVFSFGCRTRFSRMPELNATDLYSLENSIKDGENLISHLKEEIKSLLLVAREKQENIRVNSLQDENKKLQNELDLVKKELVKLQVANGVPQITVPGDEVEVSERFPKSSAEVKEQSTKQSTEVSEHSAMPTTDESSKPDGAGSEGTPSIDSKPENASKVKKQAAPAVEELPIDVSRLDLRVGRVLHAQVHPDADQLYIEQIDVGEEISRTVVSGLVRHIPLAELDQRMVVVLCNLKPQKMRGIVSEAMVMCASTPETVELLTPPPEAKAGDNITVPGYPRNPDLPFMNPKKKIFDKLSEDLKVNKKKQASYKDIPWQIEGKPGFITVQALSGCYIR